MQLDPPHINTYQTLPQLTAREHLTLVTAVVTASEEPTPQDGQEPPPTKPLPEMAQVARVDMVAGLASLSKALKVEPNETLVMKDRWLDGTCRALFKRTDAFDDLPPGSLYKEEARVLFQKLFPSGGLAFTKLRYHEQWAVCKQMHDFLSDPDHPEQRTRAEALLGKVFVDAYMATFTDFSQSANITEASAEDDTTTPEVLQSLRASRASTLYFVHKLIGGMNERDSDSVTRTRVILKPIDEARERARKRK